MKKSYLLLVMLGGALISNNKGTVMENNVIENNVIENNRADEGCGCHNQIDFSEQDYNYENDITIDEEDINRNIVNNDSDENPNLNDSYENLNDSDENPNLNDSVKSNYDSDSETDESSEE